MKFNTSTQDAAEGFAFAEGQSANDVLHRIGSEYYEVDFHESKSDVYAYDSNVYKVTISIELA